MVVTLSAAKAAHHLVAVTAVLELDEHLVEAGHQLIGPWRSLAHQQIEALAAGQGEVEQAALALVDAKADTAHQRLNLAGQEVAAIAPQHVQRLLQLLDPARLQRQSVGA